MVFFGRQGHYIQFSCSVIRVLPSARILRHVILFNPALYFELKNGTLTMGLVYSVLEMLVVWLVLAAQLCEVEGGGPEVHSYL